MFVKQCQVLELIFGEVFGEACKEKSVEILPMCEPDNRVCCLQSTSPVGLRGDQDSNGRNRRVIFFR